MFMDMHIKYWRKGNEVPLNKLSFTCRLQFLFMWPKFWPILNVSTRPISNWWGNWSRTGVTLTQGQTSYNRETTTWKGSSKFQIHYVHVHINLISPKYLTFSWFFLRFWYFTRQSWCHYEHWKFAPSSYLCLDFRFLRVEWNVSLITK